MLEQILGVPLGHVIQWCYSLCGSYVLAIVLFTFLTKIILLPVSLWVHRTGIRMVELMPELYRLKIRYYGDKDTIAEETQALYKRKNYHPLASTVPMIVQIVLLLGVIDAVKALLGDTDHILNVVPAQSGGASLLMPLAAGAASLALTLAQNVLNPLQKEQSKAEQFSTGAVSVGISLFLGAFVSIGTCVYWIFSNLFSIPQQLLMNLIMPAKRYVDYRALEESRNELEGMEELGSKVSKEDRKREKADYKRFFSVANKHLVFYSEKSGFYQYYEDLIQELLDRSNVVIHYVTSDPADKIFDIAGRQPRIRPYYIGEKKLITLMMKMDADIVVMTTPDLENFHIKRSYVRKDIEYIFVNHGLGSVNTEYRTGALDHFDTIYLNNDQDLREIRAWEAAKGLPEKRLVEYGYPLMDRLLREYEKLPPRARDGGRKKIVIAPSWQPDNIMEGCIEQILDGLRGNGYELTVRPHPQYMRHHAAEMKRLEEKYRDCPEEVRFDTGFSSFESVYGSDLLITDWSGVGWEFCFTACRPVLFIHTPMKIMNPEYQLIQIESFAERLRGRVGKDLYPERLDDIAGTAAELLASGEAYRAEIETIRRQERYNLGCAAQAGAADILERLKKRQEAKKTKEGK